jgi:hypothetical protein
VGVAAVVRPTAIKWAVVAVQVVYYKPLVLLWRLVLL